MTHTGDRVGVHGRSKALTAQRQRRGACLVTVQQAFDAARALGIERLDAQLLIARHAGRDRAWVLAHPQAALDDAASLHTELARRAAGEPLAYLVGHKEFHGLELVVDERVLIPRPETETLVEWALECIDAVLRAGNPAPRVLDLGTGSGAIALALKAARPAVQVTAIDANAAALAVARANAQRHGLDVAFAQGDWWQALALEPPDDVARFDVAVANPPYVAEGDPHLAALRHEPRDALVAGADGLAALRAIVRDAAPWLRPRGWLLLEHGHDQGDAVAALLSAAGLKNIGHRRDLAGMVRCTGAAKDAAAIATT
jgi:release factor glutamine methyltransferase